MANLEIQNAYWVSGDIKVNAMGKKLMQMADPDRKFGWQFVGYWTINGKYVARQPAINTILETLRKMQADYPISDKAYDNVIKEMISESVKVELYDASGNNIKTFHVGGTKPNTFGTYMVLENNGKMASSIYPVGIPNFNGYLNGRFFCQ